MQHFSIGVVTFSPLSSFCTTTAANCFQSLLSRIVAFVDVTFFFLSFGASSVNDHHCFFFSFFFNCCPPLVGNCQLHYTATTTAAQMLHNQLRRKCVCVCAVQSVLLLLRERSQSSSTIAGIVFDGGYLFLFLF